MALAELIEAIERRLGVRVSEADVSPETFGTVGRLVAVLVDRLSAEEPPR